MTTPNDHSEDHNRRPRNARGDETLVRNVAVVVFGPIGRPLPCDAGDLRLRPGDKVIVDDRRGGALARVTVESFRRQSPGPLARVLRMATTADLQAHEERNTQAARALAYARERARALKLDIKVFQVDLSPRRDRATVYFASEQRIDFRDLLKDLGAHLRARVELRQVGVRDEAKLVGGIGSCGRELCCSTFLPKFEPISIRMAKNQNLALTPSKISGQCGRLKCCLVYEEAQYIEAAKSLPKLGKSVQTPEGVGRVQDLDILRGRIRVFFPDRPPQTYTAEQVSPAVAPSQGAKPLDREASHNRTAGEGPEAQNPRADRPPRSARRRNEPQTDRDAHAPVAAAQSSDDTLVALGVPADDPAE